MSTAPFLSRHLGDYLLVAQLSEDALGTVFRALYAADERRFVRLRILRSEELLPEAILWAIRKNAPRSGSLVHEAIVVRQHLDVVDGIPFMTWDETAGWTLDTMLARVRALGIRIPAEYALLIAERIAAALEHSHQTIIGDRPADHGLLWPGFVSISHDAAVRVGGYGIADGVLPSLNGLRMAAEIAPYIAPEVRNGGKIGANSDVYSLGAIVIELTTGRRPSLDTPAPEMRAGDPRSEELADFLKRCLAAPEERFASAVETHRALQQMVTGSPYSLYNANLSLFLYKLLNPESQSVAPSGDWVSTNPVVVPASQSAPEPTSPPLSESQQRRKGDIEPAQPVPGPDATLPDQGPAALPELADRAALPAPIDEEPAPIPVRERAVELLEGDFSWQNEPSLPAEWKRPAAVLAAAAGLAVAVFLVTSELHFSRSVASGGAESLLRRESAPKAPPSPALPALGNATPEKVVRPAPPHAGGLQTAVKQSAAPGRPRPRVKTELRRPAEELRLRAALARIEADRVNARETAGDLFGEGRHSEEEGERLMRQRDYDAAQLAFSRAARLFQQAQEITWEERVRQTDLSSSR
ncbi:MAG TPA: hypothetical protein VGL03_03055 [Thermoanaerobaculia bacterium]|jgi:hypothetical protein